MTLLRTLAWRRLVARPVRSALTAAGVAVGVAFLFSILSLNAQIASAIEDTATLVEGPNLLQVVPASSGGLPEELLTEVAEDPRVAVAAPLLVTRATVSSRDRESGVHVLAGTTAAADLLPADALPSMDEVELSEQGGDIGISRTLARRLDLGPGEQLVVHASTGRTPLRVAAVASTPLIERINGGLVLAMPLERAQDVFGRPGRIDQIVLRAAPGVDVDALRDDLASELDGVGIVGSAGEGADDGAIELLMARLATSAVGALVVIAGVVLVFHTMSMAAAERRTEIALAGSLGSTRRQLLLVALTEAAMLGGAGAVGGILGGGLLARLVVPLASHAYGGGVPVDIPTELSFQIVPAVVAAVAGIVGAVAGAVVPARAAANAAPVDAFRPGASYEWRDPARPARRRLVVGAGIAVAVAAVAIDRAPATGEPTDPATMLPMVLVYVAALLLVPVAVAVSSEAAANVLGRLRRPTARLAGDALRANPRRTTINVTALLLPVAIVVGVELTLASGGGRIEQLARATVGAPLNVDADSYIGGPTSPVAPQPMVAEHRTLIESVPGVRAVLPHQAAHVRLPDGSPGVVYAAPLAAADRAGVADAVQVAGVARDPEAFTRALRTGELAASRFALRLLDVEVGDRLTLPTPAGPRRFRIGATFDDWAFRGTFYVDHDTYREAWDDDAAYRYAVVPDPGVPLDRLARDVGGALDAAAAPARVVTREEAVADLVTYTTTFFPLFRAMTLASFLFAALALANAAFTAVTERRWLVALQRALGMTTRQVVRSLALEAAVIGAIATVFATVVGVAVGAFLMGTMSDTVAVRFGITVPWAAIALAAALGIVVALTATWLPRRTARRVTIVEALRFD